MYLIYILFSILAGVAIVIQRIVNFRLSDKIGLFQSTFYNYIVGLTCSTFALIISGELLSLGNLNLLSIPLWAYIGGFLGVIVVSLSSVITPKVSSLYLTLIIFIGQIFTGVLIDFITISNLSIGKIIGGIFIVLGLFYNSKIDKKQILLSENSI